VLKPLWLTKSETATRLRSRIERVLDWAKAHGHREGENPAAWKGNLKDLLPALATRVLRHQAVRVVARWRIKKIVRVRGDEADNCNRELPAVTCRAVPLSWGGGKSCVSVISA
jgi:hypothetical protein